MKVEYKLPKGYRWVRGNEIAEDGDMLPHKETWTCIKTQWDGYKVGKAHLVIRKIKRKKP